MTVRILTGGGKDASGNPTTQVVGRPGFGRVVRGFRQTARRLSKRDPVDGILNANIRDVPMISLGSNASLTTALTGTNNDLVFTAKQTGPEGEKVTVTYVDPGGVSATLAVTVTGTDISVSLGRATSAIDTTATALKAAVDANPDAAALVTVANAPANDGSGLVTAMAKTSLLAGTDGVHRHALPKSLTPGPSSPRISGHEENAPTNPDITRTATTRVRSRGTNRSIRKR